MKLFFCSSITALLIGLCGGCASAPGSDGECFDKIAKDLEPGGSSYVISSNRRTWRVCEQIIKETEQLIWDSPVPSAQKRQMQRIVSQCELSARLLGFHELKGWGISSKQLPGNEMLFRSRIRVLLPPAPKGLLWNIFSQENCDLKPYFKNLPADTFAAGAFNLNPAAAEALLTSDKKAAADIAAFCKMFLQVSLEELLKNSAGIWHFAVVCDEANDLKNFLGFHGALTIPDRQGKIFNAMAAKFKLFSGIQADMQKRLIKFPKVNGWAFTPVICGGKESFTVYTTPGAIERICGRKAENSTLRICGMNNLSSGVAAIYFRNGEGDFSPYSMDTVTKNPSWQIIQKLPDGFLSTDISSGDLNTHLLRAAAIVPIQLLFELFSEPPAQSTAPPQKEQRPQKRTAPSRTEAKVPRKDACLSGINKAGKAVMAAAEKGQWPGAGISGLRELVTKGVLKRELLSCPLLKTRALAGDLSYANCHYLYFGKPAANSPKTPVLMELPFLHKKHLAVFYADGKSEKLHLSGQRSARRAVSYLHTLHSYEEEEFMRLMMLAGEFDKILER